MRRLLVLLAFGFTAALQASVPTDSIDDFIAKEMREAGVPGLAYAVVDDGVITNSAAHGVKNTGSGDKVSTDTPFITGSVSKSFTALAVMQLVEAEKIDLDEKLSQYLSEFADQPAGAIKIRQLLSHTSGFSTFQGNVSHTEETGGDGVLAYQATQIAKLTPANEPGTQWEYSNQNYKLLGRLIEVVSGTGYVTYVETNIMKPVGMANSFVSDGESYDQMATGHRPWFGSKHPMRENPSHLGSAPQGGIVATAADLARYMQMMMNGEDDVLSAEGKAAMMRPAGDVSPSYGFGWFIDREDGTVSHSGASPGFEALATMIPSENKGVVVLVNAGSGIGFGETIELRNGITARAIGLDYAGEASRFWQKTMFVGLALLPIMYFLSMIWAWRHRSQLRAKSGAFGLFSLWFPLLTTIAAALFIFMVVPRLFSASVATIRLFQPDTGLILIAAAVAGVAWAVLRLVIAYSGKAEDG